MYWAILTMQRKVNSVKGLLAQVVQPERSLGPFTKYFVY
jgi:hypothetical protein